MTKDDSEVWITEVVRSNGVDLLGYFIRRVPRASEAPDLLANVFVVIWRRRRSIPRDAEQARMWCFGIARHTLRDYRRGRARQLALADKLRDHLERRTEDAHNDPAQSAETSEQAARLQAALTTLDSRSRELIRLIHWDEFTIAQAAKHMGMNESSARTRYARARTKLAGYLAGEGRTGSQANDRKRSTRPTSVSGTAP